MDAPELPAHIVTIGSALECFCEEFSYANDLRTLELLQHSDNTGDQAAVVAARKLLQMRVQKRAADRLPADTEKGGEA